MTMDDIIPDKHDSSYELIRETVKSLSYTDLNRIDVSDLDMLYFMAVGTWKGGIEFRLKKIEKSNLPLQEKKRLKLIFNNVVEKAKNYEYGNREKDTWSIGMFGTGFYTFNGKSDKENAQRFISLCIRIKDLENEEEILNIAEETLNNGIKGMQAASASIVLHCLKPNVFPIINSYMIEAIVLLEGEGVILNKPNQLTNYIENSRKIKKFRDEKCKFINYRALDMKLWEVGELKGKEPEYMDPTDISKQRWIEMLKNQDVFRIEDLDLVIRIFDMGRQAFASKLAERDNKHPSSYNAQVIDLSKRIQKHTNCNVPERRNDQEKWWNVPFYGVHNDAGAYNWILRPELKEAIYEEYETIMDIFREPGENHLTPPEFFQIRKEDFMKNEFEKWMKEVENKLPSTAYNYTLSIDKISKHYSENTDKYLDIYNETDIDLLRNVSKDYGLDGKYSDFGNYGNGTIRNAFATYIRFLEDIQMKQEIVSSSEKKQINNIHSFIYDINKDKNKKENWTRYILEFHKQWIEQNMDLPLRSNSKYIWGGKVLIDPDLEIADVFEEGMDKVIVRFFDAKGKNLIREIEEEDLIQIVFLNNLNFFDFKRIINKLLLGNENIGNIEVAKNVEKIEDEPLNLASTSINNIKNELNTFKNILDYYETTIIQLNQTIDAKDEIISYQENTINNLEEKLKENEESLKELEYIKETLEEIKGLLEKV